LLPAKRAIYSSIRQGEVEMDGVIRQKASTIIVTGFLGAGKTTLVNRILTADHGRRIAVIVNEFGQVGIDHHLLISTDQEVIQMSNGCICCTVRGDLVQSLFQLAEHREKFDTVIIETTGLAEPAPVAQTLYADERIRNEFSLDGVVTVVDAKHVALQLEESAESCEQIAFADLIILNKTDLSTPEELDRTEGQLRALNRIATICRAKNSEFNLSALLGLKTSDFENRIDAAIAAHSHEDQHDHCEGDHGHDHNHQHHHHHHNHLKDITTVCMVEPREVDSLKLSLWFRSDVGKISTKLLRMKGILNLHGDPDQFLFQGVRMEVEGRPGRPWSDGEERISRLVFIGRDLDEEFISTGFRKCLYVKGEGTDDRVDPFGRHDAGVSSQTLEQIKFWMRQNFGFAKTIPIIVKEVPCVKPACPPIETAIVAILNNEPPRHFKIQRPIQEVTFDNVYDLIENPMPCC
jgi:G3E family GTPase